MGAFNTVRGPVACPRCGAETIVVAQFKFGSCRQLAYEVGDLLAWGRNDRGTPGLGSAIVDAVAETGCGSCGYGGVEEWDLAVRVEHDRLVRLEAMRPAWRQALLARGETYLVSEDEA